MKRCLLAVLVLALVLPAAASAHATMTTASPATQSRVDAGPAEVRLRFDQRVGLPARAIQVFATDGRLVSKAPRLEDGGREIAVALDPLARGEAYTVRWRALSADGHIGSGVYTFGLGVDAPPPTEAVGAGGGTWKDDVAKWAGFAALAILLGPLFVWLVLLGAADPGPRARRAFYACAAVGAFAVIDVGILAFVLRSSNALQLSVVDLMYGDLSPFAEQTRFGLAFIAMTLGFGVVAAFAILGWVLERPLLLWPSFVLALGLASGYSLSGHQATEANSSALTQLADWVHIAAASIWVGGVGALAAIVWPLAPALRRIAFLRFARAAVVLIGLVVLAGAYLAIVRLPDLADLWQTRYGQLLLVKVGIVLAALAWGGLHHFVLRPRLERGDMPGFAGRSLLGESAVAMAVLVLAAILVNGSPPAPEPPTGGVAASAATAAR